jgi:glycosyltransferase involved in cell wall biosynthesis
MTQTSKLEKPGLAIISNCLTPYRVHLHSTIADRLPEVRLHTLITHGAADFDWKIAIPQKINAVSFGAAGDSPIATLYHAPLREWRKGRRLIDYLQEHGIRAVIGGIPRYPSYLRVLLHCQRTGLPIFINSDANIRNERSLTSVKQSVKRRFHRWWIKRISGVMSMGSYGDEYFLKYGIDADRIYRMPYWPDFGRFAAIDLQRLDQFRDRYGLCCDRRYFVFSGRLSPVKRVDLLIDAFAKIAADRSNWDLLIVGDGVLREELRRRVPTALDTRVHWIGFLDGSGPAVAYHAADVLVLPSDREPWAVVVQEAMAAGLAVVASDVVGAAREMVTDGINGQIFAAGDVDSLAAALLDVSDPSRLPSYKERSRTELEAWCKKNDPVDGIRRALTDCGVLDGTSPVHTANVAVG